MSAIHLKQPNDEKDDRDEANYRAHHQKAAEYGRH